MVAVVVVVGVVVVVVAVVVVVVVVAVAVVALVLVLAVVVVVGVVVVAVVVVVVVVAVRDTCVRSVGHSFVAAAKGARPSLISGDAATWAKTQGLSWYTQPVHTRVYGINRACGLRPEARLIP